MSQSLRYSQSSGFTESDVDIWDGFDRFEDIEKAHEICLVYSTSPDGDADPFEGIVIRKIGNEASIEALQARYLVTVSNHEGWTEILIATEADYQSYLMKSGFLSSMLTEQAAGRLFGLAEKAFRAWHGHGFDGYCMQCDPETTKNRRQEREAIQRKAAERAARKHCDNSASNTDASAENTDSAAPQVRAK